jgi:tRNA 2-thiouridine synthesizing protein A
MKADATLDCVGMYCPMPIIKTAKAIKDVQVGQVLEIVADDPGLQSDIPAWCKTTGHECLGVDKSGREFKAYVRRTK